MYTRFIYVYSSLYSKAALLNYELEVDITGCPLVTLAQSDTLEHFAQRYPLYIWRTRESNEWIKVPHWCVFCCCPSSFLSCFSISLYLHAYLHLHLWMTIAHEISVPCFFFFHTALLRPCGSEVFLSVWCCEDQCCVCNTHSTTVCVTQAWKHWKVLQASSE